jgi:hypothetical protein
VSLCVCVCLFGNGKCVGRREEAGTKNFPILNFLDTFACNSFHFFILFYLFIYFISLVVFDMTNPWKIL